jgi:hypothetical protein
VKTSLRRFKKEGPASRQPSDFDEIWSDLEQWRLEVYFCSQPHHPVPRVRSKEAPR